MDCLLNGLRQRLLKIRQEELNTHALIVAILTINNRHKNFNQLNFTHRKGRMMSHYLDITWKHRLKCFFGFHWKLHPCNGMEPDMTKTICGWCKKEL